MHVNIKFYEGFVPYIIKYLDKNETYLLIDLFMYHKNINMYHYFIYYKFWIRIKF